MSRYTNRIAELSALHGRIEQECALLALVELAERARHAFPNAAAIHLEATDQNDSGELWVQDLYDNKGYIIAGSAEFDREDTVAFHLHEGNEAVWQPFDATTLKINERVVLDIDKILETVVPPAQTHRILDASTGHLPGDLRLDLNCVDGVICDEREYGWIMYVPPDIDEVVLSYTIPAPIVELWRAAEAHGCRYVLIDGDARTVPGLATYEDD